METLKSQSFPRRRESSEVIKHAFGFVLSAQGNFYLSGFPPAPAFARVTGNDETRIF